MNDEDRIADLFKKPVNENIERVLGDKKTSKLHIPHYEERIEHIRHKSHFRVIEDIDVPSAPLKKSKKKQKDSLLLEFFKFSLTAGAIFCVLFGAMNFHAFQQIIDSRLNPDKFTAERIGLEGVIKGKNGNTPNLLPTAGMERENRKIFPALALDIAPLENRIVIPSIAKNIPIIDVPDSSLMEENWKELEKNIQDGLKKGVVHYPGTAIPGQKGNVFITGHSSYYLWDDGEYKDVFALLHDVEIGDRFTIYWNQNKHDYLIRERKIVSPEDTSVLDQPKNENIATLMTCTPIGTARDRLIIIGEEK